MVIGSILILGCPGVGLIPPAAGRPAPQVQGRAERRGGPSAKTSIDLTVRWTRETKRRANTNLHVYKTPLSAGQGSAGVLG
jgi:hypothetical protein